MIVTTDKTIIKFYVPPMMTAIFSLGLIGSGTTVVELSDESEEEVEEVETFSEEGAVESM